jgi:transposase
VQSPAQAETYPSQKEACRLLCVSVTHPRGNQARFDPRSDRHGRRPRQKPQRLIADNASEPPQVRLKKRGIGLIVPHKANRVHKPTQDGRSLRRYRQRWKIERSNAWLGNFRRLVVRYERLFPLNTAFFHISYSMIVLNRCF